MKLTLLLLPAALVIYPFWRICVRAGFPGWIALLIVVPLVNLGLLYFLAFADWPSLRGGARIERVDRDASE